MKRACQDSTSMDSEDPNEFNSNEETDQLPPSYSNRKLDGPTSPLNWDSERLINRWNVNMARNRGRVTRNLVHAIRDKDLAFERGSGDLPSILQTLTNGLYWPTPSHWRGMKLRRVNARAVDVEHKELPLPYMPSREGSFLTRVQEKREAWRQRQREAERRGQGHGMSRVTNTLGLDESDFGFLSDLNSITLSAPGSSVLGSTYTTEGSIACRVCENPLYLSVQEQTPVVNENGRLNLPIVVQATCCARYGCFQCYYHYLQIFGGCVFCLEQVMTAPAPVARLIDWFEHVPEGHEDELHDGLYLELDLYFLRREALRKPLEKLCKMTIEVQSVVDQLGKRRAGLGEVRKVLKDARWQLWLCFKILCANDTLIAMFASGPIYNLILLVADMLYIMLGETGQLTIPSSYDRDEFANCVDAAFKKKRHLITDTFLRLVPPRVHGEITQTLEQAFRFGGPGQRSLTSHTPLDLKETLKWRFKDSFNKMRPSRDPLTLFDTDLKNHDFDFGAVRWAPMANSKRWHILPGRMAVFVMSQGSFSEDTDRDPLKVLLASQNPMNFWKPRLKTVIMEAMLKRLWDKHEQVDLDKWPLPGLES